MNATAGSDVRALLDWYLQAGVDEAVGEAPVNRFEAAPPARRPPKQPAPPPSRSVQVKREPAETRPRPASADESQALAEHIAAACDNLDDLADAIANFNGCNLKNTATNTVFADGNPAGRLMIVGEAPGADEDRQGKPFVGVSGQLLDRMMAAAGYRRADELYISNILPWRPPGNRKPTPVEVAICLPFIRRHIALKRPAVLMLAGGTSLSALMATELGITRMRGRWLTLGLGDFEVPVMPTYHPAFLLRQPARKAEAWRDILEVKARLAHAG